MSRRTDAVSLLLLCTSCGHAPNGAEQPYGLHCRGGVTLQSRASDSAFDKSEMLSAEGIDLFVDQTHNFIGFLNAKSAASVCTGVEECVVEVSEAGAKAYLRDKAIETDLFTETIEKTIRFERASNTLTITDTFRMRETDGKARVSSFDARYECQQVSTTSDIVMQR